MQIVIHEIPVITIHALTFYKMQHEHLFFIWWANVLLHFINRRIWMLCVGGF